MNTAISSANRIKKLHVQATVEFAINSIPGIDRNTLEKFSELINATGNFGPVSEAEILDKMSLIMKYIPGACARSLLVVAELLDIRFPRQVVTTGPSVMITPLPAQPKLLDTARMQ